MRFLALCDQYGSQRAAVGAVAAARKAGVAGLPLFDDWTAWNGRDMTAAVKYLQSERLRVAPRPAGLPAPD